MKKIGKKIRSSILVGLVSLALASGWTKNGTLTEISKPYLGEYACEVITFDGKDKLADFEYFKLEICSDGQMKLCFKEKGRKDKTVLLEYEYDEQKKEFTVKSQFGIFKKEEKVPYEDGRLTAFLKIGGKHLIAKFSK